MATYSGQATDAVIFLMTTLVHHPETPGTVRDQYYSARDSSNRYAVQEFFLDNFNPNNFRAIYPDDKKAMRTIFIYGLKNCNWERVKQEL